MKTFYATSVLTVLAFCSLSAVPFSASENYFVIEGMQVEWEYQGDLLTFRLHSPYQGWVGLGFNDRNDIVSTNLVMGAVTEDVALLEEYYVMGVGDPQPITSLGGKLAVRDYEGTEDAGGTTFEFTIDASVQDKFHYDLRAGNKIWLICAYAMEDDFGHHSIMRRHLEIEL